MGIYYNHYSYIFWIFILIYFVVRLFNRKKRVIDDWIYNTVALYENNLGQQYKIQGARKENIWGFMYVHKTLICFSSEDEKNEIIHNDFGSGVEAARWLEENVSPLKKIWSQIPS